MTEYAPQSEPTDSTEVAIDRMMNSMGIGRTEAEARLGIDRRSDGVDGRQGIVRPQQANRPVAKRRHSHNARPAVGEDALPILDTTWGDMTMEQVEEQLHTNAIGIAAIRAQQMETAQAAMTPEERREDNLRRLAREQKRRRG